MTSLMAEALKRLKVGEDSESGGDQPELNLDNLLVINKYCTSIYDKMNVEKSGGEKSNDWENWFI